VKTRDKWLLAALCAVGAAITVSMVVREERDWEAYRDAHGCVQTDETKLVTIYTGRAPVTVTHARWVCENGKELWRRPEV
jgi:hypothetical protein